MRGPSRLCWWAITALVVLLAAGCAEPTEEDTRSATAGLPDLEQELAAEVWVLDGGDSSIDVEPEVVITLEFHGRSDDYDDDGNDGTLSGTACNEYHGTFEIDVDDTLAIGDVAQTMRLCEGPEGDAEVAYLAALVEVDQADTTDRDRLVLEGDGGLRLAFDARDDDAD